jgi:hypothetical protein
MQGMSTREPRAISDRLRPEMIQALLRGWAEHGSTRTGLVARRLACPGTKSDDLRLTPMGRQWAAMLATMASMHNTLHDVLAMMDGEIVVGETSAKVRATLSACKAELRGMVWP